MKKNQSGTNPHKITPKKITMNTHTLLHKNIIPQTLNIGPNPQATIWAESLENLFKGTLRHAQTQKRPCQRLLPLDMHETENEILIELEAPGINPEDLELNIQEETLKIIGKKHNPHAKSPTNPENSNPENTSDTPQAGVNPTKQKTKTLLTERAYGQFQREIHLPYPTEKEKIQATFRNGILTVQLPKTPATQPKKIPIQT
jgi:HSP20 family molecular chaperone IbpA